MTNYNPAPSQETGSIVPSTDEIASPESASFPSVRFAMVAIYVEDLQRSVDFYRLLGLELEEPRPGSPVVIYKEGAERRMIIGIADVARRFDNEWSTPTDRGYRQVVEFFVDDDAAVDAAWQRLTDAGYQDVSAPSTPNGAYTALVRDPDGHVVMITHEP